MNRRQLIATSLFVLGLAINPAYFLGCAAEEEVHKFDYGEEEMLGLLEDINAVGSWTVETEEGVVYTIELALAQGEAEDEMAARSTTASAWTQTAHACGTKSRMFGAGASACSTWYETLLPLEGTLRVWTEQDGETVIVTDEEVFGKLAVDGPWFKRGHVRLWLEGSGGSVDLNGTTLDGLQWGTLDVKDTNGADLGAFGELMPTSERAN